VLKTSGTIIDQAITILIYLGAIKSFISGETLKRIKVKEVEHDDFSFVEMDLGAKH
jgi:hypothetical protein